VERGSGTTPRSFERRLTVSLLILLAVAIAPSAQASNGWVNGDYYGINFQQLRELKPSERGKHLARIAKLGIHDIRVGFAWPRLEPLPPVNGQHQYRWTSFDGEIASLARHGIRAQANITQTLRVERGHVDHRGHQLQPVIELGAPRHRSLWPARQGDRRALRPRRDLLEGAPGRSRDADRAL